MKLKSLSRYLLLAVPLVVSCQMPSAPGRPISDLVVSSIQSPTTAVAKNAMWALGATVTNNGGAASGAFTMEYKLSTKSTLDSSATLIGTSSVPALAAGQSHTDPFSASYSISQLGTYWLYVTVEPGNTATNTYKAAKIDTGYEIQVPLFINQGYRIRIDSRTGEYSDRVANR